MAIVLSFPSLLRNRIDVYVNVNYERPMSIAAPPAASPANSAAPRDTSRIYSIAELAHDPLLRGRRPDQAAPPGVDASLQHRRSRTAGLDPARQAAGVHAERDRRIA